MNAQRKPIPGHEPSVEELAKMVHNAYNNMDNKVAEHFKKQGYKFAEWSNLGSMAKQSLEAVARFLLDHYHIYERAITRTLAAAVLGGSRINSKAAANFDKMIAELTLKYGENVGVISLEDYLALHAKIKELHVKGSNAIQEKELLRQEMQRKLIDLAEEHKRDLDIKLDALMRLDKVKSVLSMYHGGQRSIICGIEHTSIQFVSEDLKELRDVFWPSDRPKDVLLQTCTDCGNLAVKKNKPYCVAKGVELKVTSVNPPYPCSLKVERSCDNCIVAYIGHKEFMGDGKGGGWWCTECLQKPAHSKWQSKDGDYCCNCTKSKDATIYFFCRAPELSHIYPRCKGGIPVSCNNSCSRHERMANWTPDKTIKYYTGPNAHHKRRFFCNTLDQGCKYLNGDRCMNHVDCKFQIEEPLEDLDENMLHQRDSDKEIFKWNGGWSPIVYTGHEPTLYKWNFKFGGKENGNQ
jgi:hypothetical protein